MNKFVLLLAPVLSAGVLFGISGSSFLRSGAPEEQPEHTVVYGLPEKGEALLNREIIEPLRAKKGKRPKAEMYSRCPSGVTYYLTASVSDGDENYEGQVLDRMGCSSKLVCLFRIDKNEEVLEAKSTEEAAYLPVAEWKKTTRNTEWSF